MGELDAYRLAANRPSTSPGKRLVRCRLSRLVSMDCNANLVLDTGAGDTVLDTQFAINAGVRLGGQERRTFAGGVPALVTYGHAEELLLDGFGIHDIPVQVIDIPPDLDAWFPDLPIHGILGTGVLSRFRTSLDYRSGRLRLESTARTGIAAGRTVRRTGRVHPCGWRKTSYFSPLQTCPHSSRGYGFSIPG